MILNWTAYWSIIAVCVTIEKLPGVYVPILEVVVIALIGGKGILLCILWFVMFPGSWSWTQLDEVEFLNQCINRTLRSQMVEETSRGISNSLVMHQWARCVLEYSRHKIHPDDQSVSVVILMSE